MAKNRIFYIFHGRYPSEKAAALFAAKSCEAFGAADVDLVLLVPRRLGRGMDPYEFYKINKNFKTVFLPTLDLFSIPILKNAAFYVSYVAFSLSTIVYLWLHVKRSDWVYSNESLPLYLASRMFPHTLYEVHDYPEQKRSYYEKVFQSMRSVLVTNQWKIAQLKKDFGVEESRILCERNAVDIKEFSIDTSKQEARDILKLPQSTPIILYTGHLYSWKGAHVLAEAGRHLDGVLICFVGGTGRDVTLFRGLYGMIPVIQFYGHQPHEEIPLWQKAADVLVLPNTAKEEISRLYTSPMKLFEYMASGRPIIASDIPSIREVVTDSDVYFVEPDSAELLAKKIKLVLREHRKSDEVARRARDKVMHYTWEARARRVLVFMESQHAVTTKVISQ